MLKTIIVAQIETTMSVLDTSCKYARVFLFGGRIFAITSIFIKPPLFTYNITSLL